MTEPLPLEASDETFAEPKPDGALKVVFKDSRQFPQVYDFTIIKRWHWRTSPETSTQLVIVLNDGNRIEIPELGILTIFVKPNSDKYLAWRKMQDTTEDLVKLEYALGKARDASYEAWKEWEAWRATS